MVWTDTEAMKAHAATPKTLLVLGSGTAGTMVTNKLGRRLPAQEWHIVIV